MQSATASRPQSRDGKRTYANTDPNDINPKTGEPYKMTPEQRQRISEAGKAAKGGEATSKAWVDALILKCVGRHEKRFPDRSQISWAGILVAMELIHDGTLPDWVSPNYIRQRYKYLTTNAHIQAKAHLEELDGMPYLCLDLGDFEGDGFCVRVPPGWDVDWPNKEDEGLLLMQPKPKQAEPTGENGKGG